VLSSTTRKVNMKLDARRLGISMALTSLAITTSPAFVDGPPTR